jgi:hypothetical protein
MFSNKSWYFSTVMCVVLGCLAILTLALGFLSFKSIFETKIYLLGQSGWTVLLAEIALFLISIWVFIVLIAKYFVFNSYFKIDKKGIEIRYLSRWFKPILHKYKWSEIETIGERIGKIQYEFFIKVKSKDSKKDEYVLLPFELWQSTFRVRQLRKEVENHSTHSDFTKFANVILISGDVLIIILMLIFFSFVLFSILSSFTGLCSCLS